MMNIIQRNHGSNVYKLFTYSSLLRYYYYCYCYSCYKITAIIVTVTIVVTITATAIKLSYYCATDHLAANI